MAIHMLRNLESKLVRKKLAQVGAHILPAPLFSFEGSFLQKNPIFVEREKVQEKRKGLEGRKA
ncbi:hypothetical protein MTR_8g107750 [Medicago truncatula]|uniref:Uncharacterized protein n=1 Tax=Medicago truncatula TaxID=3880 RepID=G7LEA0_MEDTR|nr:hypothetical protein MTR_8g107750 [Medicago truncatula]